MIRFILTALALCLTATGVFGEDLTPDTSRAATVPSVDTMYVIPAGPLAGTLTNQARVTVNDTIAGWAKIQVEGWVPVRVALPYLRKAEADTASVVPQVQDKKSPARQCAAITKNGTRCTRKAKPGSIYCWQHEKQHDK